MQEALLIDLVTIILAATGVAFVAKLLRQPLIPAYIIAGVLIGPLGLGIVRDLETVSTLAELGIAFLLFIVGMELSGRRLRNIGKVSTIIGVLQVGVMLGLGYLIALFIGFSEIEAIYIGLIVAFSSTMVVIKLLDDKGELDTLHGRITLGVLLVQDIIVIIAISFLINLGNLDMTFILGTAVKGLGMLSIAIIASKFILPHLFKYIADSQELLFLSALSWLFMFSGFAYLSGFSIAIGAFVAGVGLASFPYNLEIVSRMKSLKDFFITIFFVILGVELARVPSSAVLPAFIALTVMVIVLKPFITALVASFMRYGRRTSFLTAINLGQVSEFSLIIAMMGLELGHIGEELFATTIIIALVTITISTYFIAFDQQMFALFGRIIPRFHKLTHEEVLSEKGKLKDHIILLGCHNTGHAIYQELKKLKIPFIVVDFDPEIVEHLKSMGTNCIYGDVSDIELLHKLNLRRAKMIISTVRNEEDNALIIDEVRKVNKTAPIIMAAKEIEEALMLYDKGADYVILPRIVAGERIAKGIDSFFKKKMDIEKVRNEHLNKIKKIQDEKILYRYGPRAKFKLREKLRQARAKK
ncbi:MAG: cation:proton antiporter [archaeon]